MYSFSEQQHIRDLFLKERLETVLPRIMKETGTEFWIIASREYHEDPMFRHIVPSRYPTARRLTILIFALENGEVKRISVSMPDPVLNEYYEHDWDRQNESQFEALTRIIRRIDPKRITVNVSEHHYAYTDGLSHGLYLQMKEELPEDITARFCGSDEAGIRLL